MPARGSRNTGTGRLPAYSPTHRAPGPQLLEDGLSELQPLLEAGNINSLYHFEGFGGKDNGRMLLLGRRQRIAHGAAASVSPGEEPVDLAVSVPPSLEVVGETDDGNIEMGVRIRFAPRLTDKFGVVSVDRIFLEGPSAAPAPDVLEDYLAECKGACDGEIDRLFASGERGSNTFTS